MNKGCSGGIIDLENGGGTHPKMKNKRTTHTQRLRDRKRKHTLDVGPHILFFCLFVLVFIAIGCFQSCDLRVCVCVCVCERMPLSQLVHVTRTRAFKTFTSNPVSIRPRL